MPGVDALTRDEAVADAPGVASVSQSFNLIIGLTYIVITIVIGFFFVILTVQKAASLTLLRAIGADTRTLVGALFVRRRNPRVLLAPLIDGGGHERGMRSGTLNVPGIVGFGKAAELCRHEMGAEAERLRALRDRLHERLHRQLDEIFVEGLVHVTALPDDYYHFDAIGHHAYTFPSGKWEGKGPAAGFPESQWISLLSQVSKIDDTLTRSAAAVAAGAGAITTQPAGSDLGSIYTFIYTAKNPYSIAVRGALSQNMINLILTRRTYQDVTKGLARFGE